MNEADFTRRVSAHLSASARNLDGDVVERLRAARERALAARRPAGKFGVLSGRTGLRARSWRVLRPLAMSVAVLAAVIVGDYWATWAHVATLQEVDTALLIDDLPIDAYLDTEFKAWVQHDSRS